MDNQPNSDTPSRDTYNQTSSPRPPQSTIPKTEVPNKAENRPKTDKETASDLKREFKWFEVASLIVNACLAITGIFVLCIYSGQLKVMQGQLKQMESSSAQTDNLVTATQTLATAARGQAVSMKDLAERALTQAVSANKLATDAKRSADISQTALEASVNAAQLDQRAWVGLSEFATVGGTQTMDGGKRGFSYKSVQIAIRNSGKTPAINLSATTLQITRDWREKIGDYDVMTAQIEREQEQISTKLLEDQIRRNPAMEDSIRSWNRETKALITKATTELFPAGQVLAPGVGITQGTPGVSFGNLRGGEMGMPLTVYILGKITYNDIFTGTPLRTTKYCLMRMGGTQFTSCPTGNYMD